MAFRATRPRTLTVTHVAGLVCLVLFVSLAWWLFGVARRGAITDDFRPVAQRLTYSTDTSPVDIEVVGSTSMIPRDHQLIPELVLRLRLARAYVDLYAERDPGFEILSIGVDFETTSPMALFLVARAGPPFSNDVPGIPKLPPDELRRRNIVLEIKSNARVEGYRIHSERLSSCHGDTVENGMWEYERKTDCFGLGYRRFGKVARLEDGFLIELECDEARPSTFARCQTRFPFKGFMVGLNFHRDLLPRWQEVIRFSEAFLTSKRYPPAEVH
jgi:hypothetical protein